MVSTRKTPPAIGSPLHKERRQKRMPSCSSSCATSPNRSGRRGAKIITARGWLASTFSKARNSSPSSSSTVLPQTTTGPAPACWKAERRLATIARSSRRRHVKLQIPTHLDALRGRTNVTQPAGILLGLRQKQVDVAKHSRQNAAHPPVSRPGSIGNARIHHRDAGPAFMRQPQEVRPELGFGDHNQRRLQRRPDKVEWQIPNPAGSKKRFPLQNVSSPASGRSRSWSRSPLDIAENAAATSPTSSLTASTSPTETAWTQIAGPDCPCSCAGTLPRRSPRPSRYLPWRRLAKHPIGQADQQACRQQRAVKQVHEGRDILTASCIGQGTATRGQAHPIINHDVSIARAKIFWIRTAAIAAIALRSVAVPGGKGIRHAAGAAREDLSGARRASHGSESRWPSIPTIWRTRRRYFPFSTANSVSFPFSWSSPMTATSRSSLPA